MRIVDIFYKNIEGQASDIKGNINIIGHIMTAPIDVSVMPTFEGYFEIDGSTVTNAITNYPKLHNILLYQTSFSDHVAQLSADGNDIILSGSSCVTISCGEYASYIPSGSWRPDVYNEHSHQYWQGDQVNTSTSKTKLKLQSAFFTTRTFIYHGVH